MQKVSNSKFLTLFITSAILLLCAKLLAVGIDWFLPQQGVVPAPKSEYVIPYKHIDFHNMLVSKRVQKVHSNSTTPTVQNINNLILKGLYGNSSYGYAIVAKKSSPNKTTIVGIGEAYLSYKLKKIALDYVVFSRSNKEYVLRLTSLKTPNQQRVKFVQNAEEGDTVAISRNDINYYSKNIDNLDHDIAVDEVYKNGKIHGFKVRAIRRGSKIAQIGLKQGDIILKANNVALTSYNDAFKIYQNLSKLQTIDLLIKRGNQEKELLYEIH